MGMDKLVTTKDFPDPKEGETLQEYIPRYTRWITKEIYFRNAAAINFLLSIANDGFFEFKLDGQGAGENGNWRINVNGADLRLEHLESGTWVHRGFLYKGS